MSRPSVLCSLALLLVSCSPSGETATDGDATVRRLDYFDIARCWIPKNQESFSGVVAFYKTPTVSEALIFSGLCQPGTKYSEIEMGLRVRLVCISGFRAVQFCKASNADLQIHEDGFDPGIKPEFPESMYSVEGQLSGVTVRKDGFIIFDLLNVTRAQKMPKEVYGAFLSNPRDRQYYIKDYLGPGLFTEEGYKIHK